MKVKKTSIFPANEDYVFKEIKKISVLEHVAYPYAAFKPINETKELEWKEGETFSFRFKLFTFIPFGTHRISVIQFDDKTHEIYTHEKNTYVHTWNHRILLETIEDQLTRYTDEIEIKAGPGTIFVYMWASLFYTHRQRKWKKYLRKK